MNLAVMMETQNQQVLRTALRSGVSDASLNFVNHYGRKPAVVVERTLFNNPANTKYHVFCETVGRIQSVQSVSEQNVEFSGN